MTAALFAHPDVNAPAHYHMHSWPELGAALPPVAASRGRALSAAQRSARAPAAAASAGEAHAGHAGKVLLERLGVGPAGARVRVVLIGCQCLGGFWGVAGHGRSSRAPCMSQAGQRSQRVAALPLTYRPPCGADLLLLLLLVVPRQHRLLGVGVHSLRGKGWGWRGRGKWPSRRHGPAHSGQGPLAGHCGAKNGECCLLRASDAAACAAHRLARGCARPLFCQLHHSARALVAALRGGVTGGAQLS